MSLSQILLHFTLGFVTSFIGSIPLGSINAGVVRISLTQTRKAAFLFIAGATLAELFYSFIAIHFSGFLLSFPRLEFYLQLVSIPVFLLFGLSYWRSKPKAEKESPPTASPSKPFVHGLTLGFLNPLQIPFWLAYGAYYLSVGWIAHDTILLNIFIAGIVTGSSFLLYLLARFASSYGKQLRINDQNIHRITAVVFFLLAFYQVGKMVFEVF